MIGIRHIALDLEGTLVSNAFSQIPRPGLHAFLEFSLESFQRVMIFSCVSTERSKAVIDRLVQDGFAPKDANGRIEHIEWEGQIKDLRFIDDAAPQEILLVEDQEIYVHPGQITQWVPIPCFDSPYPETDIELTRVTQQIRDKLRTTNEGKEILGE